MCGQCEDLADSAHAHRPFIKDAGKCIVRGAREHVGPIHQRKSSSVIATPRGLHLGSGEFRVSLAAQAFGQDSVCRLKNAFENDSLGWNDSRHPTSIVLQAEEIVAPLSEPLLSALIEAHSTDRLTEWRYSIPTAAMRQSRRTTPKRELLIFRSPL